MIGVYEACLVEPDQKDESLKGAAPRALTTQDYGALSEQCLRRGSRDSCGFREMGIEEACSSKTRVLVGRSDPS